MDGMKVFGIASVVIGFVMLMGSVTGMDSGFAVPSMGFDPYVAAGTIALVLGVMILAALKSKR